VTKDSILWTANFMRCTMENTPHSHSVWRRTGFHVSAQANWQCEVCYEFNQDYSAIFRHHLLHNLTHIAATYFEHLSD